MLRLKISKRKNRENDLPSPEREMYLKKNRNSSQEPQRTHAVLISTALSQAGILALQKVYKEENRAHIPFTPLLPLAPTINKKYQ